METENDRWKDLFEDGARVYPTVLLDRHAFAASAAAMRDRARRRAECDAVEWPGQVPVADVYLAIACDVGAPGAWETFEREYLPRLRGLMRHRGGGDAEIDPLLADLPGTLCQPPADGRARTRLGTYDGSASLFSWLAVVALRRLHHARREADPQVDSASEVAARRTPPSHAVVGTEMAQRFQHSFAAAWTALTPRERLAVLLHYRDGLSGGEIARTLGVGEPRVSRLLKSGLARLGREVHSRMPETPPGTSTPDQAIWHALAHVLTRHLAMLDAGPHVQDVGGE